jgi:hypothetical protein
MRVLGVMLVAVLACGCRQLFGIDDTTLGEPADAPGAVIDMATGPADAAPVDAPPPADARIATVAFEDGIAGYAGTLDSDIDEEAPDTVNGAEPVVNYNIHASGEAEPGLLQFAGIFGAGASQIPPGATILDARVRLSLTKTTNDTGTIHEVTVPWDETVTWNTFGPQPGVQPTDLGALVGIPPMNGTVEIELTDSVARWSEDPAQNRGWIFQVPTEDGGAWRSAESGGPRPRLTVQFSVP